VEVGRERILSTDREANDRVSLDRPSRDRSSRRAVRATLPALSL
jgi:hypothetical protein